MDKINAYSPSFQANLVVEGLKFKDQKKLQAVKQLFAQKTQHYADDTFLLKGVRYNAHDSGHFRHRVAYQLNENYEEFSSHLHEFREFFENNSAEDIARGLVRIFKHDKAKHIYSKRISRISRNLKRTYAGNARNLNLAEEAEYCGDKLFAQRYRYLAESSEKRSQALLAQRKAMQSEQKQVLEKVTDHPIFDIVY